MNIEYKKLGDVAEFIRGITYKPNDLVENFSENSTVCMRTANVQAVLKQDDLLSVPLGFVKNKEKFLTEGDLLVSTANSWNLVGKCCWVPKLDYSATAGGFISILRANEKLLDKRYLYHWFNSSKTQQLARNCGRQTTNISNMDLDRCLSIKIPLPPLEEQRRIAAILDKADELRQKRQQSIEKLDQLLQATFIDMFGDPVSNPKGWDLIPSKNVLKIQGGYAFSSTEFSSSGIPVVKIGNANKLGFNTDKFDFIVPKNPEKLTQYELRKGDLLMSLTGTVGKDDYGNITEVTDYYEMYYLNQRVAKLDVINSTFTKNYVRYFFSQSSIKSLITKNNRGVRQANISNSDIYELNIPLPTKNLLMKFDSFVESINELKLQSKSQLIQVDKLFKSLQNQAFSGTL